MSEGQQLRISDHALVRYIERVKGVCLDEYRDEIRALAAANGLNPPPAAGVLDEGLVLVVEELGIPVVATVLGPGMRPKRGRPYGVRFIHVPAPLTPAELEADSIGSFNAARPA